jgi:hypothetical protein
MKTTTQTLLIMGLLLFGAGCKPSHRINFKPANVSVDPGEGWKRLDVAAEAPVCSPRLICNAGMINALYLDDFTDVKKAADFLQSRFATTGNAAADSFKQEDFTTDSGLRGIHLSYTAVSKDGGTPGERSHSFITQNMMGKCISVSYITSPGDESAAVIQAICKSLRVE